MRKLKTLEIANNDDGFNIDEDGMSYFGMFTEIDGKIVYRTAEEG